MIKKFESFTPTKSMSDMIKDIYPTWKSIVDMYPNISKYQSDIRYPDTQSIYISEIPVSTPRRRISCGWGSNFSLLGHSLLNGHKDLDYLVSHYNNIQEKENQYRSEIDWKNLRNNPDKINQDNLSKLQTIDGSMESRKFLTKMNDALQQLDMYHLDFIDSYFNDIQDEHGFILDCIPYYFEIPKDEWSGRRDLHAQYNLKILFKWRHNDKNNRIVDKIYDDLKLKMKNMIPKVEFMHHDNARTRLHDALSFTFKLI